MCVFACVTAGREEFVFAVAIRSSQSSQIGVLSGQKHTHTTKRTLITPFATGRIDVVPFFNLL